MGFLCGGGLGGGGPLIARNQEDGKMADFCECVEE